MDMLDIALYYAQIILLGAIALVVGYGIYTFHKEKLQFTFLRISVLVLVICKLLQLILNISTPIYTITVMILHCTVGMGIFAINTIILQDFTIFDRRITVGKISTFRMFSYVIYGLSIIPFFIGILNAAASISKQWVQMYLTYYPVCWFLVVDFFEAVQFLYRYVTLQQPFEKDLKPLKRSISPKGRIRGLILVLAWISLVLLCFRQDGFSVILDCTRLAALLELKRAVTKIMKKHYARKMEGMHSEKSYLPQSMASQRSSKHRSLIRSLREPSIGVEQGVNLVREPSALSRRDLHRAHSKKDLSRVNSISRNGKIVKEDNPPVINPIEQSPANIQTSNTSEMLTIPEKALDEQDDHSHTPSEAIPLPALPETKITVEDFQPPNVCCDSGQTLQSKSSDQVKAE